MKKIRYIVRVSPRSTIVVMAENATQAKSKVWQDIKDQYTYGFKNRAEFMRKATATRSTRSRQGVYY